MNKVLLDAQTLQVKLNLASIKNERQFLRKMQDCFVFPAYFGGNFNALDECMCDLSWFDEANLIIEFDNVGQINNAKLRDLIQNCLLDYQDYWRNCVDKNVQIILN